jgi:hypothetical protein
MDSLSVFADAVVPKGLAYNTNDKIVQSVSLFIVYSLL